MSISSLDLNLLVVLDAVLGERSVARAARRLHVTPSAVSNALARLRIALDDPLLARSGRGIVPTPRALELAPVIARALRELDVAILGHAFDPATTTRRFTLAVADVGQVELLPRIAQRLVAEMPRAHLRVLGIDSLMTHGGLAGPEIDVAIGLGEGGVGIHDAPLGAERLVPVARTAHPFAGARVSKAQLAALRHVDVQVAPGHSHRGLVAAYAALSITRDVAIVVPSFAAATAIIAETDLVAALPAGYLASVGPRLGLRELDVPLPRVGIALRLLWHERTHLDPAAAAFRELILRRDPTPARHRAPRRPAAQLRSAPRR